MPARQSQAVQPHPAPKRPAEHALSCRWTSALTAAAEPLAPSQHEELTTVPDAAVFELVTRYASAGRCCKCAVYKLLTTTAH